MRPNSRTTSGVSAAVLCAGAILWAVSATAAEKVPFTSVAPFPGSNLTNGMGSWIWDTTTFDKQTCRFWRAFDIPHSTVAKASLKITVDNGYRLFLDGREIGRGSDWRTLT